MGWSFTIKQDQVSPDWIRQFWPALVRHIEARPFFYRWDDDYPEDTVYAWVDGKVSPPRYSSPLYMSFEIKCRGLHVV